VNFLARRGQLAAGSELLGEAFENWVFHELGAHNAYLEAYAELSYWRLASGIEVDFIVGAEVAIEAKAARKVTASPPRARSPPRTGRRCGLSSRRGSVV
jgi:uncharacterized protein